MHELTNSSGDSKCHPEPYIGCPYPCPWVLGGYGCDIIVHGWAWVQYYEANDNERLFICPIQPRLGVGG